MRRILKCLLVLLVALITSTKVLAQDCYESSIITPAPFMGNNDEIFTLADGSIWQVKYEYEYMYEYYPSVLICPGLGKLIVGQKTLNIVHISGGKQGSAPEKSQAQSPQIQTGKWEIYEDTSLQGSISGTVKRGRIFKTTSGNVYEVTGITLQLVLQLQPDVMVLRNGDVYKLVVKGFDEPLICRKLN
jgi:hypothetical protein